MQQFYENRLENFESWCNIWNIFEKTVKFLQINSNLMKSFLDILFVLFHWNQILNTKYHPELFWGLFQFDRGFLFSFRFVTITKNFNSHLAFSIWFLVTGWCHEKNTKHFKTFRNISMSESWFQSCFLNIYFYLKVEKGTIYLGS